MANRYKYINNKKWYYYLDPKNKDDMSRATGLFEDLPPNIAKNKLLIHYTYGQTRLFAAFDDHIQFLNYMIAIPPNQRSFYETILGSISQKPHFDLDLKQKDLVELTQESLDTYADKLLQQVLTAIIAVLEAVNVTLDKNRDILIFTSHGPDKRSFHIIIDNYYHANHKEAKAFYDKVLMVIEPQYQRWLDVAVYSSKQQFRTLGSQKWQSNRIKVLYSPWTYQNKSYNYRLEIKPKNKFQTQSLLLQASLITITRSCKALPSFIPETESNKKNNLTGGHNQDIQEAEIAGALQLVRDHMYQTCDSMPFSYKETQDALILLTRERPSFCLVCQRTHENENPFVLLISQKLPVAGNFVKNTVYFYCRRADDDHEILGYFITNNEGEVTSVIYEPQIKSHIDTNNNNNNNNNRDIPPSVKTNKNIRAANITPTTAEKQKVTSNIITQNYNKFQSFVPQANYQQPIPQANYRQPIPQSNYQQPIPQSNYQKPIPQSNYQQPFTQSNYQQPFTQSNYQQPFTQARPQQPFTQVKFIIQKQNVPNPQTENEVVMTPQIIQDMNNMAGGKYTPTKTTKPKRKTRRKKNMPYDPPEGYSNGINLFLLHDTKNE